MQVEERSCTLLDEQVTVGESFTVDYKERKKEKWFIDYIYQYRRKLIKKQHFAKATYPTNTYTERKDGWNKSYKNV